MENIDLWVDALRRLESDPKRMVHTVTAFPSTVSSIFVSPEAVLTAIDELVAPVLLMWGDQDKAITRDVIDHAIALRPDRTLCVLETSGHIAPLEFPDRYGAEAGAWYATVG